MSERKRKPKFSREELDILVTEVTWNEARLFGRETVRLSHADRDKIWEGIARKITSVSQVPRSVKDIKHRWDDMKRRTKDKLAFMQRSLSSPSSPGRPSAIVLTAHERAIKSTLHSSHQIHGFRRADLDVVDSPSASSDECEALSGPSRQHHFVSLQREAEEVGYFSMPSFLHSLPLPDSLNIVNQKKKRKYRCSCSQSFSRPSQPYVQRPPASVFNSCTQHPDLLSQFCQELVAVHKDMADNLHAISQRMSDLTGQVSQMCKTLTKIKDELHSSNKGQISNASQETDSQAATLESSSEPKAEMSKSCPKQAPLTRTTRSQKRKHHL